MKKLLNSFNIDELHHKTVILIWLPLVITVFLIVLSVFVSFIAIPNYYTSLTQIEIEHLKQEAIVMALVVFSNALILVDTFIFTLEGDDLSYAIDNKIRATEIKKIKRNKRTATVLNWLTIIASGIIIFMYTHKLFGGNYNLEVLFITNEIIAVGIFLFFCISDKKYINAINTALENEPDNNKLKKLKSLLENAFPLIDLVGLIGVFIVTALSIIWHYYLNDMFVEGFALGAITFHIILTQFNWAYLRTMDLRD